MTTQIGVHVTARMKFTATINARRSPKTATAGTGDMTLEAKAAADVADVASMDLAARL